MIENRISRILALILTVCLCAMSLTACGAAPASGSGADTQTAAVEENDPAGQEQETQALETSAAEAPQTVSESGNDKAVVTEVNAAASGILDGSELFTERDLTQKADLSESVHYSVADGEDIHITGEGVYVLTGTASNTTVYVEAGSEDKVQLVLQDLHITNDNFPCIYAVKGDKVFVTSEGENSLSVTGTFAKDGSTNTDGVIFTRTDLVLNGLGTLSISSTDVGVVCKDDLKITGGTYEISAGSKAF